jgi:hypothetical protein
MDLIPNLTTLPPPQQKLFPELAATPQNFTLYGGTALALRFGHRISVDFDFFSNDPCDPDILLKTIPYLKNSERVIVAPDTLTCRIDREGPVLVSFFGNLGLGQVAERDRIWNMPLYAASLLDLAGTKAAVIQKRAELKDYRDIDALLQHGLDLPTILAAGSIVYGADFNPLITLKALCYFDDVAGISAEVCRRLSRAAAAVDVFDLPNLKPFAPRPPDCGGAI